MPKKAPPIGFETIQHEELSRLFGRVTLARLAMVPVLAVLVVWLLFVNVTPWRRGVLLALGVTGVALFILEVWRHRKWGLGRLSIALNMAFAAVGQGAAAFATGGLESPIFFVMYPIGLVIALQVEAPLSYVLFGVQFSEIWLMLWSKQAQVLPQFYPAWPGDASTVGWGTVHLVWSAIFASLGVCLVAIIGRVLRGSFDRMVQRGMEAREEILQTHRDRAHELAALSGEIAHELKNPLASIKGLSALLAHDAPTGKTAERLQVMRGEIDRMQGILEGFLNFSRPLVPLSIETVDLNELLVDVVCMHEGLAHERGVRLLYQRGETAARCDPRKIKQAVINLVQNALDASPPGTDVELLVRGGAEISVEVLDRGPGVDSAVAAHVFEPGVTAKANGSGLGLTIVRALARQHGGEIDLSPRPEGGTIARLRLPKEST